MKHTIATLMASRTQTLINRLLALGFALGLAASAQAADIALLDQNYVLFNSVAAQEATAALKQEFADEEQRVQTLEQSIRQLQSKAKTDADIMTDDEKTKLKTDLQDQVRAHEQLVRQLQQVQNERRKAFIRQHQPLMAKAIEQAVDKDKYDLIIDKNAVIYHRNSLDITEAVLTEFNKLYQAQQEAGDSN